MRTMRVAAMMVAGAIAAGTSMVAFAQENVIFKTNFSDAPPMTGWSPEVAVVKE